MYSQLYSVLQPAFKSQKCLYWGTERKITLAVLKDNMPVGEKLYFLKSFSDRQ